MNIRGKFRLLEENNKVNLSLIRKLVIRESERREKLPVSELRSHSPICRFSAFFRQVLEKTKEKWRNRDKSAYIITEKRNKYRGGFVISGIPPIEIFHVSKMTRVEI